MFFRTLLTSYRYGSLERSKSHLSRFYGKGFLFDVDFLRSHYLKRSNFEVCYQVKIYGYTGLFPVILRVRRAVFERLLRDIDEKSSSDYELPHRLRSKRMGTLKFKAIRSLGFLFDLFTNIKPGESLRALWDIWSHGSPTLEAEGLKMEESLILSQSLLWRLDHGCLRDLFQLENMDRTFGKIGGRRLLSIHHNIQRIDDLAGRIRRGLVEREPRDDLNVKVKVVRVDSGTMAVNTLLFLLEDLNLRARDCFEKRRALLRKLEVFDGRQSELHLLLASDLGEEIPTCEDAEPYLKNLEELLFYLAYNLHPDNLRAIESSLNSHRRELEEGLKLYLDSEIYLLAGLSSFKHLLDSLKSYLRTSLSEVIDSDILNDRISLFDNPGIWNFELSLMKLKFRRIKFEELYLR